MTLREKFYSLLIAVIFLFVEVHCQNPFRLGAVFRKLSKLNEVTPTEIFDAQGFAPITIYDIEGEIYLYFRLNRTVTLQEQSFTVTKTRNMTEYDVEGYITVPSSGIVSYQATLTNQNRDVALLVRGDQKSDNNWGIHYYGANGQNIYDGALESHNVDSAMLEDTSTGIKVYRRLTNTNSLVVQTFSRQLAPTSLKSETLNFEGATLVYYDHEKTYFTTETKDGVLTVRPVGSSSRTFKMEVDSIDFVVNMPRLSQRADGITFCYVDSNLKRIVCQIFGNDNEAIIPRVFIDTERNVEELYVINVDETDALVLWIESLGNDLYDYKARLIPEETGRSDTISVFNSTTKFVNFEYNAGRTKHCLNVKKLDSSKTLEYCIGI